MEIIEQRKVDGKTFTEQKSGAEAISFIARITSQVDYSDERKKERNLPKGWKYGINKESNGRIIQYACDFRGNKELVKEMKT